jgi:hypothetical protein
MSSIQPVLEEERPALDKGQDGRSKPPGSTLAVWLREPLLQFLLIGAVLFVGYAIVQRNNGGTPSSKQINLTSDDIRQLDAYFESQWHRPPTSGEFAALVETKVQEEVLFRKGMAMGLDKNDTIVKRRIAQKCTSQPRMLQVRTSLRLRSSRPGTKRTAERSCCFRCSSRRPWPHYSGSSTGF